MTTRETVLAAGVGGVLAVAALHQVLTWAVLKPFNAIERRVNTAQARQSELLRQKKLNTAKKAAWENLSQRTLGVDPVVAAERFHADIQSLLRTHQLEHGATNLKNQPHKIEKTCGLVEVSVTLNLRGELPRVVALLRDIYRRPYFTRVDLCKLDAGEVRPRNNRGRGAPAEPLAVNMRVYTLVLPRLQDLKSTPIEDLAAIADKFDDARLPGDPAQFDAIAAANIFRWNEPPRPPEVAHVEPQPPTTQESQRPVRRVTRPRESNRLLCGVTSLHGEQIAYVRDEAKREEAPVEVRVNDELDGGRLVLVHPLGAVVHVDEGGDGGTNYFYPLGRKFGEREVFDRSKYPEIDQELRLVRGES
ncbi:MAG: hypothetical protein CHACPFDD_01697 [Phycisphaerae bacterium]|nr:hypothetical protein [Phycisphaerae bacterium]